jgi:glycosyltransferase involved in cell wall biosynthesis
LRKQLKGLREQQGGYIMAGKRLKIFTWHIHGSYLYYLTQANCDFYLPKGAGEGYGGRAPGFAWGDNVHDVPLNEVSSLDLDCIIFQSVKNYEVDQYQVLSEQQRKLPRIYLEHDPPRESPTDTKHSVDDPDVLLVHVTHFNDLMWDSNRTPTTVIEHGVTVPGGTPELPKVDRGIVVVNNLPKRGRRLGLDVFERARKEVPLDLVGMGSAEVGGLGEVAPDQLYLMTARYRFFFNPIRYTSMGLAVCEAMMNGLPIIGLATTEMPTVVQNGVTGYIDTTVEALIPKMKMLLDDPEFAATLGRNAARYAHDRFNIVRFKNDWERTLCEVAGR